MPSLDPYSQFVFEDKPMPGLIHLLPLLAIFGLASAKAVDPEPRSNTTSSIPGACDFGIQLSLVKLVQHSDKKIFRFDLQDNLFNGSTPLKAGNCEVALASTKDGAGKVTSTLPTGSSYRCDNPRMSFSFTGNGTGNWDLTAIHTITVNSGPAQLRQVKRTYPTFNQWGSGLYTNHTNQNSPDGTSYPALNPPSSGVVDHGFVLGPAPAGSLGDNYIIDPGSIGNTKKKNCSNEQQYLQLPTTIAEVKPGPTDTN